MKIVYISLDLRLNNSMAPVPDIHYVQSYPDDSGHMEEKSVSVWTIYYIFYGKYAL